MERPEDEHYKHLVAELADSYMRRPGVVIVATITCTADIDTQVCWCVSRVVCRVSVQWLIRPSSSRLTLAI